MNRLSYIYGSLIPLALLLPGCKAKPVYNPAKGAVPEIEQPIAKNTGKDTSADSEKTDTAAGADDSVLPDTKTPDDSIDKDPTKTTEESTTNNGDDKTDPTTPVKNDPAAPGDSSDTATLELVSHGKGGPTGTKTLKSASGLQFMINAPADVHTSGKAYGVLVLLHGSTASNYTNFVKMMANVSKQYNLIPVSVLAPNGKGWNEGGEVAAADALHALVQNEIIKKYNIDKTKILFSGQSSGAGFLSTNFVPQHAKDYQGGAFMQCGAAPPRVAFTPDATTKSRFKLHFEITTGDPIWPKSYAAALPIYKKAGMQFTSDNTKPGGHCAFDQQKVIQDHIGFILGLKK